MQLIYNIDFELAGLIFNIVFYIYFSLYYPTQSEINQRFKVMLRFLILAELMDILTAVTISCGSVIPPVVNIAANTLYFTSTFSLSYIFLQYVKSYVSQNNGIKWEKVINRVMLILQFAMLFINMFTGFIFGFNENGEYVHGRIYLFVYIVPMYYTCVSAYILFKNHKLFKKKQIFSIITYMVCLLLGVLIQMLFFPDVLLALFTCSIAVFIIMFSMETPDYQLLMKTLAELNALQKNLQQEVKRQTKEAEDKREKVERLSQQVILTLAKTIDAKDKYTKGHSERVADYSREIAGRMNFSEQQQQEIYRMGLLHDIGKIGIPDTIINKTGKLTDEEFRVIQSHPVIGSEILSTISELPEIASGARSHHERYNGTGYPDKLAGENIPLASRIIGVADAYDAMTSKRSYRDTLPQEVVRAEIVKGKGTQFDPRCADIMLEMIDEDKEYAMKEHYTPDL